MDQLTLGNGAIDSETVSTGALTSLSDLELVLVGGGIGDTIL